MDKTIWKYPIGITDTQAVMLPEGAWILTVQMQGDNLCLWAMVEPEAPKKPRVVRVFGTGHPIPNDVLRHISTVQMHGGALVWHVFEVVQ